MAYQKDELEIGALWIKTSRNGVEFMSGTVNGLDIVCFRNKGTNPKSPAWTIKKSQPRDGQSAGTRQLDTRESEPRDSRVDDINAEDIPF